LLFQGWIDPRKELSHRRHRSTLHLRQVSRKRQLNCHKRLSSRHLRGPTVVREDAISGSRGVMEGRFAAMCAADSGTVICKRTIGCSGGFAKVRLAAICAANNSRIVDKAAGSSG
jgi:hypothetical protein